MWALRHAGAHSVSTISAFISSKAAMSRNKFESKECYCVTEQTTPNQKGDPGGDHNRPKQTVEPMNDVTVQGGENEWLLDDLMNIIAKEQLKEQNDL